MRHSACHRRCPQDHRAGLGGGDEEALPVHLAVVEKGLKYCLACYWRPAADLEFWLHVCLAGTYFGTQILFRLPEETPPLSCLVSAMIYVCQVVCESCQHVVV